MSNRLIRNYKDFCDKINQSYKKYNILEDDNFLKYEKMNEHEQEEFINRLNIENRNKKIDYFINS